LKDLIQQQKESFALSAGKNTIIPLSILDKALVFLDQKNPNGGANINTTA
jgi:hypothetical protein